MSFHHHQTPDQIEEKAQQFNCTVVWAKEDELVLDLDGPPWMDQLPKGHPDFNQLDANGVVESDRMAAAWEPMAPLDREPSALWKLKFPAFLYQRMKWVQAQLTEVVQTIDTQRRIYVLTEELKHCSHVQMLTWQMEAAIEAKAKRETKAANLMVEFQLVDEWPSKSGNHHMKFKVVGIQLNFWQRLMIQQFLGSDPYKEMCAMFQEMELPGMKGNVLFRPNRLTGAREE